MHQTSEIFFNIGRELSYLPATTYYCFYEIKCLQYINILYDNNIFEEVSVKNDIICDTSTAVIFVGV